VCGIAGYSLSPKSSVGRTLAAQALLAAIAERGADAAGYAYRTPGDGRVHGHKQRSGARALLDSVELPADTSEALIHVRDYTKGHPTIEANNHPIRHGAVVGIHNGIIFNDEEILERHGFERAQPEMTVDSEAIFALAEHAHGCARALEELRGSMACAWLDERRPDVVFLARGVARPLWIGAARHERFFASTPQALEIVERYTGVRLRKREVPEGTLVALSRGREAWSERFRPDRRFEERELPAVRAPHEGASCLQRLATLAAAPTSS
jgi:glucosamine 6-phosphate synthetase-like amidotransferase/phosphosugar isomerase protein